MFSKKNLILKRITTEVKLEKKNNNIDDLNLFNFFRIMPHTQ